MTTTVQTLSCPCCNGSAICDACAGTGSFTGVLPEVLYATFYGNFISWGVLYGATMSPWLDGVYPDSGCFEDGVTTLASIPYPDPPFGFPGLLFATDIKTIRLVYDPTYLVAGTITSAWVFRDYSVPGYFCVIYKMFCSNNRMYFRISWYLSDSGFAESGTGTGTGSMNGDPAVAAYAELQAYCDVGHSETTPVAYTIRCDVPYFVFGNRDTLPMYYYNPPQNTTNRFVGSVPDQTVSGNYISNGGAPYATMNYFYLGGAGSESPLTVVVTS